MTRRGVFFFPGGLGGLAKGIPDESNWTRQFLSGMIMALCAFRVQKTVAPSPESRERSMNSMEPFLQNPTEAHGVPGYATPIRAVVCKWK
jgi:hypothetical protein